MQEIIQIDGLNIGVQPQSGEDFISLTDLARRKTDDPKIAIANWMRNRNTIELLGIWETVNNPDFKGIEFDTFRKQAGLNSFTMTPTKWINSTNARGIRVKRGRYGGTYAHVDIALDFATWISPEFRLRVFQEYRQLKADETSRLNLEWQQNRLFSALNYRIHTDAIKDSLPENVSKQLAGLTYAQEADVLNLAVFGMTAKQWRETNSNLSGNMRDHASATQLLVLNNLEAINAMLIKRGVSREDRYRQLYDTAREQEKSFKQIKSVQRIENKKKELES
ncbi:KilA-N domain-containing protein [Trueperella pyogenes]|uniref:KilA-N domain-containing protein n=1 Tax=Trueperella pyogenes TaxID=1661 RepID=UPI00345D9C98